MGFFFYHVSGNSVIATFGVAIVEELLIDGKFILLTEIMNSAFSRHRTRAFTRKSYVEKVEGSHTLNFYCLKLPEDVHLEIFLFFENSEKEPFSPFSKLAELTFTSHETKLLNLNIRVMLYFKREFQFELKHSNHVFWNSKFIFHVSKQTRLLATVKQ